MLTVVKNQPMNGNSSFSSFIMTPVIILSREKIDRQLTLRFDTLSYFVELFKSSRNGLVIVWRLSKKDFFIGIRGQYLNMGNSQIFEC